jgi:DNA mismatch repair protein MutS
MARSFSCGNWFPGGSDRSFGIHVAHGRHALERVWTARTKVLAHLEASHSGRPGCSFPSNDGPRSWSPSKAGQGHARPRPQLSFFQLDDPALERIREELEAIDINTLTPVEALLKLNEIKRMAGAGKAKS